MRRRWAWSVAAMLAATVHAPLHAADEQQAGWAAWFNSVSLDSRWSLASDLQLRSNDGWRELRNVLARGAVSYSLDGTISVAAGYAYITTSTPGVRDLVEQRSWQQVLVQQRLAGFPLSHRLRLEQRWIERAAGGDLYSDRLRYFMRLQVPFDGAGSAAFSHGAYGALQNEVFLHLTNRDDLNGKLLDQNRAYAGLGWRFGPRADLELGYLQQYLVGRGTDTQNHVVQLALYSRF